MSNKKKWICMGAVAAGIIAAGIILWCLGVFSSSSEDSKDSKISENSTASESESGEIPTSVSQLTLPYQESKDVKVSLDQSGSWEGNQEYFGQYDVTIENTMEEDIASWVIKIKAIDNANIIQFWNCNMEIQGHWILITPLEYTSEIKKDGNMQNVGFIVSFPSDHKISEALVEVVTKSGSTETVNANATQADTKDATKDTVPQEINTAGTTVPTSPVRTPEAGSPLENHGKLSVSGSSLVDSAGKPYQLRGVSTHGLSWYPQYVNYEAFKTLRDDWGANVVRLAMYTAEYGGYCSGGNKQELKRVVDSGINYATQLGLYVIIDWHILSDSNPNTNKSEALAFFNEMSAKYANHSNVIYEICNEPQNSPWNSVIKPYAEEVISAIRKNDADAVIIVGTNTWSQDVDEVIGNKIADQNTMYALHFYATTHTDWIRNKLVQAKNAGVPVFVSECSICDASGAGGINYDSAQTWLDLLNQNEVSFIAWSLSNKAETSALINSNCGKLNGWNEDDLSETGKWFRNAIKN